jgi:CelD/BcsL family acetyltransferase involved in cellulose biosynthesis
MELKVSVVNDPIALSQIKDRWSRLAVSCNCAIPYLQFEWYLSALQTLESDKEPLVLFFTSSGVDVALAPLVYEQRRLCGISLRWISFAGRIYTPQQEFLYACSFSEFITSLLCFLRCSFGNSFILDLSELKLNPEELLAIEGLSEDGAYIVTLKPGASNLSLSLGPTFDLTFGSLGTKVRHEFARKQKRLARLGTIDLVRIDRTDNIGHHLDRFFEFYARTWKGPERRPDFYRSVCQAFAGVGQLYFTSLTLDNAPIAYLIGFRGSTVVYGTQTTYDPCFCAFSPGIVLFNRVIGDLFSLGGIRTFDFGPGDHRYKREWAPEVQQQVHLTVTPNSGVHRAVQTLRRGLPYVKRTRLGRSACAAIRDRIYPSQLPKDLGATRCQRGQVEIAASEFDNIQVSCGLVARLAEGPDVDWVTVLLGAGSLTETESRLALETCVVVQDGKHLAACFWIDKPIWEALNNGVNKAFCISDWGIHPHSTSASGLKNCLTVLVRHLRSHGYAFKSVIIPFCLETRASGAPVRRPAAGPGLFVVDEMSRLSKNSCCHCSF